jgi:hypothetical protein
MTTILGHGSACCVKLVCQNLDAVDLHSVIILLDYPAACLLMLEGEGDYRPLVRRSLLQLYCSACYCVSASAAVGGYSWCA